MQETRPRIMDELYLCFVVRQTLPDGQSQLSLSSYAPFRNDLITHSFDTEEDAALYLLDEIRTHRAITSSKTIEAARAILNGEQPLFVYEEWQPDGTLLLSLHDEPPAPSLHAITFSDRSPRRLARLLLQRLHQNPRVRATEETRQQALTLAAEPY